MDREITIRDYLNVAWSGRWLILVTTVLGIIVGILVSVARPSAYTASARVYLGQPTSINGVPIQTPFTSSQTATGALDLTALADGVAQKMGVARSVIRGHVHVSSPPGLSTANPAPPVLIVSGSNPRPAMAVVITNQLANAVVTQTGAQYMLAENVLTAQATQAQSQVRSLNARVDALQTRMAGAGASNASDAVALATDTQLLNTAQTVVANAQLALAKTREAESPRVLSQAYSATSSNTAPKRLQSIALAGLVGFLLGLIATFVWRGSPAARASDA